MILSEFINHFQPSAVATISQESDRFKKMRYIRKTTETRLPMIQFVGPVDGLAIQIEFATSFCDLIFTDMVPLVVKLSEPYRICKILDDNGYIFMITDNPNYIEFGKKFYLAVV